MGVKALAALALSLGIGASSGSAAADVVGSDRGKAERGETSTRGSDLRGGVRRGDAARGAQLYERHCGGCHSADAHRIGPLHRGVFGRRAGAAAGFDYSPALQASGVKWNEETLDRWLADPERLIPGQAMGYRVGQPQDRADLIAYLRQL
jgi:cytochrome c